METDVSGSITMDDSGSNMVVEAQGDSEDRNMSLKRCDLQQGNYMYMLRHKRVHTKERSQVLYWQVPARANRVQHI